MNVTVAPGRSAPPACGSWLSTVPDLCVSVVPGRVLAAVVDAVVADVVEEDVDGVVEVVVFAFPTE